MLVHILYKVIYMQTLYIKEANNISNNFVERLLNFYKKIFNIFDITSKENIVICDIPYTEKIKDKKLKKISKKICKKFLKDYQLKNYNKKLLSVPSLNDNFFVNKIVLSKKLEDNQIIKDEIEKYKVDILDGRWLFKYLIINILEYICKKEKTSLREKNVSILINNNTEINLNLIVLIAKKVKRLTIVSNNIHRFRYLEEKLYNDYGIAVELSNNRRKSLLNSNIIINVDFEEEMVNKYNINSKAIIINLNKKNNIKTKSFNGININFYDITFKDIEIFKENNLYNYFNSTILYESYIYRKDNLFNILDQINKDKVEIKEVIGTRGKINYKEFELNTLDKIEKLS